MSASECRSGRPVEGAEKVIYNCQTRFLRLFDRRDQASHWCKKLKDQHWARACSMPLPEPTLMVDEDGACLTSEIRFEW